MVNFSKSYIRKQKCFFLNTVYIGLISWSDRYLSSLILKQFSAWTDTTWVQNSTFWQLYWWNEIYRNIFIWLRFGLGWPIYRYHWSYRNASCLSKCWASCFQQVGSVGVARFLCKLNFLLFTSVNKIACPLETYAEMFLKLFLANWSISMSYCYWHFHDIVNYHCTVLYRWRC